MKKRFSHFPAISSLIAFAFLLMTVSCSKSNPPGSVSSPSVMTGSIGGTAFQPSVVAGLDNGSLLTVGGLQLKAGDSVSVEITFPDNSPTNTALSFSTAQISYKDTKGTFDFESGNSPSNGVVMITTLDKQGLKTAGTFSGVLYDSAKDSVVITNGQFFTTFQVL